MDKSEIAIVQHEQNPLTLPFAAGRGFATFNTDTVDGKTKLHRALHGTRQSIKGCVGLYIPVQDIVIYPRSRINDDGEVQEWIELTLISPDGVQFYTSSPHVADCVRDWADMIGKPPWIPPQIFLVCTRRTGGQKDMLFVEPQSTVW